MFFRRQRWLLLVGIVVCGIVFLPPLVLSQWGARLLERALRTPHTTVTVQRVTGGWWRALEIHHITVFDPAAAPAPLLHIARMVVNRPLPLLFLSTTSLTVRLDGVRVHLRQHADGAWNLATLIQRQPGPQSSPSLPLPFLPYRSIRLILENGQIFLEPGAAMYAFAFQAESAALHQAPLQWQTTVTGPDEASLTARGEVHNLLRPAALIGMAELHMARMDLRLLSALLPQAWASTLHGQAQAAALRLDIDAPQSWRFAGSLDLRDVAWSSQQQAAAPGLAFLQAQWQGQRQGQQWLCQTLSVRLPDGHLALRDEARLHIGQTAWQGQVSFTADLQDIQPTASVLAAFLPEPLRLRGPLRLQGDVSGTLSRKAEQAWNTRLAGLRGNLEGHLGGIQWQQASLADFHTALRLDAGVLTVSQGRAKVAEGEASVQGQWPLTEQLTATDLSWHLRRVPMHRVLGSPFEQFLLTQASGRVTHDGERYRLDNTLQIDTLALDPKAMEGRALQLTDVTLRCPVSTTPPWRQLVLATCTLEATEAHLTLPQGILTLGPEPQLGADLTGWLQGSLVNALVPEIPAAFPDRLHVQGPLTVPLHGKVWQNTQWHFQVKSPQLLFADLVYDAVQSTVRKDKDQLVLAELRATRGQGNVEGRGSWRLSGPAEGNMRVQAEQVPLQRTLAQSSTGTSYVVEGVVSGPVQIRFGPEGMQFTVEHQVSTMRLRRDATMLAELPTAEVRGLLGRDRRNTWWARQFEVRGESLTLSIEEGRLQRQPVNAASFQIDASLDGAGPWLTAFLALAGIDEVNLTGRTQATLQAQGALADVLRTTRGHGTLQAAEVSVQHLTFTAVDIAYELAAGRWRIPQATLAYQGGTITVQGNLGLPRPTGRPEDQMHVAFQQIPLAFTQQLSAFRDQGAAALSTATVLNGQVILRSDQRGRLDGTIDLHMAPVTRRVSQDTRQLADIRLPALRLTGDVQTTNPVEAWSIPRLRLQGDGVSLELSHAEVRHRPAAYEGTGAVSAQLSGPVVEAATLGFLPSVIKVAGAVELHGTAGIHLPAGETLGPRHLSLAGKLTAARLLLEDEPLTELTAQVEYAPEKLTIAHGAAQFLNGQVRLVSPSWLELTGPPYPFRLHAAVDGLELQGQSGMRLALSRILFLFPLFIFEPERDQPIRISGKLSGELQLAGTYRPTPGWSKTVHGDGHFRIENGEVLGSTVVSGFVSKVLLLPQNIVHNVLKELLTRDGRAEHIVKSLGERAFAFGTLASPIHIRAGEMRLRDDLTITSPELSLVMNGFSTLEGEVNYHVRSDLIHRLRFGEITSLPNKIPGLGKVLKHVNPFNLLEEIELGATVQGNVFQTDEHGKPAVHVDVTILSDPKN